MNVFFNPDFGIDGNVKFLQKSYLVSKGQIFFLYFAKYTATLQRIDLRGLKHYYASVF